MAGVNRDRIEAAKSVNLLLLIGQDSKLTRVSNTNGGEYAGPCPFCGGRDRLRVQPQRGKWWCRQCGGAQWSDAVNYIMRRNDLPFPAAVRALTEGKDNLSFLPSVGGLGGRAPQHEPIPPSLSWQLLGQKLIESTVENLWAPVGEVALNWLYRRGLRDDTIRKAELGYDIGENAVVIPQVTEGVLWSIKLRRLVGEPRYQNIRGSVCGVPYLWDWVIGKPELVLCEGELDTLLLWQECHNYIDVLTFGSVSVKPCDYWLERVMGFDWVGIAFDSDQAGEQGARWWLQMSGSCGHRVLPACKDITDTYCLGISLARWVAT